MFDDDDYQDAMQYEMTMHCVSNGYISEYECGEALSFSSERMNEIMEYSNAARRESYDGYELEEAQ
ncbi:hypothetical protein [Providencia stuartii]|uniref:hypothetical protein n=1 Tax=Providencia stuartii TaxID=588 RepID=UPI0015DA2245|nr:hypothetical protein [Providencia stuartii]